MSPIRPIRFLHRGEVVEVQGLPPTTSVLSWLREHAHRCGTKEGCNEGDCGACTVAVAELAPHEPHGIRLRNLNACLLFLPALDGKALFTVEDLKALSPDGMTLHPVQQALVDHHGSQCGFCTPGFVMTMWTTGENARRRGGGAGQTWADALAGNLCRCTGYRPILAAARACEAQRWPDWDATALAARLTPLAQDPPLHYAAHDPAFGAERRFDAPRCSDDLATLLAQQPDSRVLGGATDIALWVNKAHRDVGHLVAVSEARDLQRIDDTPQALRVGAAVSLEEAWMAMAQTWPCLGDLWRRFASPPVRHAGTLAGNVANGSPIGDAPPVLMALEARLVLRRGEVRRTVALSDFYLGYQRKDLQPGEFIEWIEIPKPTAGQTLRAWKIAMRYDSDISAVCGAFSLRFDGEGTGPLLSACLAFGGMAPTVQRARHAEQALLHEGWSAAGIDAACEALQQDFQPLSDLRASAEHRIGTAAALLRRLWLAHTQPDLPLEVWR